MNIVIVGYGAIGPVHADVVKQIDNANLYGVCDINRERANKAAEEYGCRAFYSYEDVLSDENVESVHICTPHHLHYSMIEAACAAGKHIVAEKPVAMKRDEFEKLLKIEAQSDKKICAVVQNRENLCFKKLREIVTSESDGKLIGIFANLRWLRDKKYYANDTWRGKWETEGGGLMINQAIHLLDMLCCLGGKAAYVNAQISNRGIPEIEVEDTADAIIVFENGAKGFFSATNLYPKNMPFMIEVNFENTSYRYSDGILTKIENDSIEIIERDSNEFFGKKYWGSGHYKALRMFYTAVLCNTDDYIHIADVEETMDVLYKFYEEGKRL